MPRHRRREEDLIASAIEAMEDEIRSWREGPGYPYGSRHDPMVRMIRYPQMDLTIGPADYIPEAEATVQHIELPKKEIPYFLRWKGMEAAIKKMRELEGRDRPPAARDMPRHVETATYTGLNAPGWVR